MYYMRRKIEGGFGALRESDDTNFLKPQCLWLKRNVMLPKNGDRY